jgi:8-oxo-dGTP pyrophosphatase MutT (NUDIX family)
MKPRTRIAGIIIRDGKLLLLKGKGYEHLWTAGGKLEEGETNEECLRRELKEEIGVDLIEAKYFKEYDGVSFYNPNQPLNQIIYIAKVEGEIKPDAEIEDFVWLSKEDFYNKKYLQLPIHEEKIIPDLIKENIW